MPDNCIREIPAHDCVSATECTQQGGIYKIQISEICDEKFYVECDANIENGGWLLIQRRQDGSVNFFRNWTEYEDGFSDVKGEFFIGLKKLYALTNYNGPQELMLIMKDKYGTEAFAKYDNFTIGDKCELYKLKSIGEYLGNAGDSLRYHLGNNFSTVDRDNDNNTLINCAKFCKGPWWFNNCFSNNLDAKYGEDVGNFGIIWDTFRGNDNLPYVSMMIRRKRALPKYND